MSLTPAPAPAPAPAPSAARWSDPANIATDLLLAFVLLLPFEPLYNGPPILLALFGIGRVVSGRTRLAAPENRFLGVAFLCIWLPMLASLPDAVSFDESLRKAASLCIYYFAGVYAIAACTRFRDLDRLVTGVALVCAFWCADALWQFATGRDWFGIPYPYGYLNQTNQINHQLRGPFDVHGRLGVVLAVFSPLVFEAVRRAARRWPWSPLLLLTPFFLVILLSGSRTSWAALAVAGAGYLLLRFLVRRREGPRWSLRRSLRRAAAAVGAAVLAAVLAAYAWPPGMGDRVWKRVEQRVEPMAGLWSGDRERIELATSCRLTLWETAVRVWSGHPLNGVGPRGFRHVYEDFLPGRNYLLELCKDHRIPKSPHLLILEIAAETGALGVLGYLVLAAAFLARLRALGRDALRSVYPYVLASIMALFPLTGHLAFYAVLPTSLIWWTLIVCACAFAIAAGRDRDGREEAGRSMEPIR